MRISLLLGREPFGTILERTLTGYWSEYYNQPVTVKWRPGKPRLGNMRGDSGQRWLVNIYLNAIFSTNAAPEIFDPIRREFSRSTVWWKRPLQHNYVSAALAKWSAPLLAQASLMVSPAIEDAQQKLIVAGNHKIRLLDRQAGLAYGILKQGFHADFMRRELATRQQAAELGLPLPELIQVAPDQRWFAERYISGTPINRIADQIQARGAVKQAAKMLYTLIDRTAQEDDLNFYLTSLLERVKACVTQNHMLKPDEQSRLCHFADQLCELAKRREPSQGWSITTALTHGDFQPANILVKENNVWLIDWEYSDRRQAGYDLLVLATNARSPSNLARRLQRFVEDDTFYYDLVDANSWHSLTTDSHSVRQSLATIFLMEELLLHLEENTQPLLTEIGRGLNLLSREIESWLEKNLYES